MSEKLATNIAMEVNAAISRIMSVIGLSFTRYVFRGPHGNHAVRTRDFFWTSSLSMQTMRPIHSGDWEGMSWRIRQRVQRV
ncbi:hypothetical protein, partial [Rhizobium johnstonii]|uniref:hypothetical protein n=1 Tax=Rhizobium johnstonii TaxID=3019933 RepID=UPI003F9DB596